MKTRITAVCLLLMSLFTGAYAQRISIVTPDDMKPGEVIDTTLFKVQYKASMVLDTTATDKEPIAETLMLEVGKKLSLYYSYTMHVKDSVLREDMLKGASQDEFRKHAEQYKDGTVTQRIYKNYPTGKVTTLDRIGTSKFRCEEKNELPQWELLPDTATVLSYLCHKAVCHFKGRTYEAWYTLEIPRSDGPWKLGGLPGLILKVSDSRKHFVFECSGLEQCKNQAVIHFNGNNYETITRKALNKLYERFAKDPVGFITSTQPNVRIQVRDGAGNAITKPVPLPYNPIELSE